VSLTRDTVRSDEEVAVTLTTVGGGCERAAGAEIERPNAHLAVITPVDETLRHLPNITCNDIMRYLRRTVAVRFDQPGLAVVRVRGRQEPGGAIITIDTSVVVVTPS
jgi:hypothetical protein